MSSHSSVHSEEYRGYTIKIHYDQDCNSPRENDNLGTIATWHRRYKLGDVQPKDDPQEYIAALPKGSIVLPVYMYEHSGIALSTSRGGQFSDPWDSGQLGVIHVSPNRIREDQLCKRITGKVRENVIRVLIGEIEEYSQFVGGECYGYIIETIDGECVDSCWGFIGYECVQQQAKEQANYFADERDRENADQREMYDDG